MLKCEYLRITLVQNLTNLSHTMQVLDHKSNCILATWQLDSVMWVFVQLCSKVAGKTRVAKKLNNNNNNNKPLSLAPLRLLSISCIALLSWCFGHPLQVLFQLHLATISMLRSKGSNGP